VSLIGALAFVVALLFSVMIHEFGHYIFAKQFGMKVTEFFLGFGKRLWSFQRGETEFGIKAIPAGGYCRIVGMSSREVLAEEDKPRAFYIASVPKRLIVLGAGSFFHFVLGFLILIVLFAGVGTTVVTNTVGFVPKCISSTVDKCAPSDPASPAYIAGIKAGDRIIAINGVEYKKWADAVIKIRSTINSELVLTIDRKGERIIIPVTTISKKLDGKAIGIIGVNNTIGNQQQGIGEALGSSTSLTGQLLKSSVTSLISLPAKIPALFRETFGNEKRDPQGLVGVVGVARVSAQTASDSRLATREKLATFLLIIASLNIFVGVFNLLPLLPLDGGHMAIAIVDGFRRWWAHIKKRPAPAPIDVERLTPVTIVVFGLLAVLSLLLLAADIVNPVHI
jgi:membrane-associated protease RseP (regulator of RpoE activity)